ncbi:MAG: condensation domain-containing protein, partial [Cyanobacteria bacterium J06597_1]
PFDGVDVELLDADGVSVKPGDVGEICVHGPGVTSGYLNRPELNDRAFVERGGKRFFRTGDLGRLHSSGNMEFLGRKDFQIKIRGQRIEILEVESTLRRAPGIRNAIVGTATVDAFNTRLIAYVTLKAQATFQPDRVRAYLGEHLPDYMQPSGWVVLEEMPLNENLKIDRSALPAPTSDNLRNFAPYEPPRTVTEQALVDIWEDVLELPQVGIHDDFMNLGGDSLIAMSVCLLASERGLNLSPFQIEAAPTIASLAILLDEQAAEPRGASDTDSGPLADFPPFIARFFLERGKLPQRWNISRLLTARQRMSFDLLKAALEQLARKHDALRLRFEHGADGWVASVQDTCDETVLCRAIDLSDISDEDRERAIREALTATQKLVSLSDSPVIGMALIEQGSELPQKLYFVVNHFVMDVVSWRNFWLELDLAYRKLERGDSDFLAEAPASFSAWTRSLRSHADSEDVVGAVQHWCQQDWSKISALPKDFSGDPKVNVNCSARVAFASLSADETNTLLRRTSNGLETERVLMAGFSAAVARWQGSSYAYFDRLVHGRDVAPPEIDLSRTLGCIISYAPILLHVDPAASRDEQLRSVSDQIDEVGNSAGAGVELYRYLGSNEGMKQRLKALPRAEILFNYRGRVDDVIERSSLFSETEEVGGFDHDPDGIRLYPFSVAIDVVQGKLEVKLVYSQNMHSAETAQRLCDEFVEFLRGVVTSPS